MGISVSSLLDKHVDRVAHARSASPRVVPGASSLAARWLARVSEWLGSVVAPHRGRVELSTYAEFLKALGRI